ncbi:MAG: hypothetical protein A2X84_14430 [Desulfuromonadaceae bacterium GWC2_58_13]|nr:MAG: hypothetical protein A2X84_14430 [Desulfuromonadaceae bacterium GWC2_58_13]
MKLVQVDPSLLLQQTPRVTDSKSASKQDPEALRKTCQQFEAIFVQSMFKAMRSTVPDGGLFPKGMAEESFQDLMDMEVAKSAAEQGRLGLGDALFQQLSGKVDTKK